MLVRTLILLIALTASIEAKPLKWQLGIGAIFQNEARFLQEWIEFHRLVGVEHFWLYNNNSDDEYLEILEPYIANGTVELIQWPSNHKNVYEWNIIQCRAYEDVVKRAMGKAEWLAILDTDEFLFSPLLRPVPKILKRYKGHAGVGVNWVVFGTSNVQEIPPDALMIEMLTHRTGLKSTVNKHVKSIVNPYLVKSINNPHYCNFKKGARTVTTSGLPFDGPFSPKIEHDILRIHHYWPRDEKFFHEEKIPRGMAWGRTKEAILKSTEGLNDFEDLTIIPYAEELKK